MIFMSSTGFEEDRRSQGITKSTFEIIVRSTQNATWQGQIHWFEHDRKQEFRSVLEMIRLIDEALLESAEQIDPIFWEEMK